MLVLSAVLSCNPAFSKTDFSFFEPISTTPVKPVKLINPLYLDTSRTIKPVIKIVTPYNPYDEDSDKEADYFTSEINDPPPSEEILNETNEAQNDESRKNYQAEEPANEFFTPPSSVVEKEIIENKSFAENNDENIYAANVNSEEQLDLNGKIISHIYFEGLKSIDPSTVRSQIKTQDGSIFNEDLLQMDLQRIYAIGFFTEKMAIEPELNKDGTVNLKFVLEENIPVNDVSIVGNTVISSMELLPFITPLKNLPQNISKINDAIDKINGYYHNCLLSRKIR